MRTVRVLTVGILVGLAGHSPALAANVTVQTGTRPGMPPARFFVPKEVTVDVGSTVTVVNGAGGGGAPHDLVWGDGAPGFAATPPPFTANINPWTSLRTFTAPGDYTFVCSFHVAQMMGTVHVVAPAAPSAPAPTGTPQPGPSTTDTTAPALTSATARAGRRAITVRLRVSEAARITVTVSRSGRTLTRRRFSRGTAGPATLRVPLRTRPGVVTVRITAADAARNVSRRTLRVRVR